mgnify:CR=1 FL=1
MTFNINQTAHKRLRSIISEKTTRLIAWIGSGVSANAELPTWPELKNALIKEGRNKAMDFEEKERVIKNKHLDSIEVERNPWVSFERLRDELGPTSFRETIRKELIAAESCDIPTIYKDIWRLGIRGIMNLNIDCLANRGFVESDHKKIMRTFHGLNVGEHIDVLNSSQPFVVNLHGQYSDSRTWVFCRDELRRLMQQDAYKTFINSCITTHTILFIGITVDDEAIGGHYEYLKDIGVDLPTHYWLTDRCDSMTDQWAENLGIRLIRYSNDDGSHSEVQEFFSSILEYIPEESEVVPVIPNSDINGGDICIDLPSSTEILKYDSDRIREILNKQAVRLLSSDPPQYEAYNEFLKEYDQAIYKAWYIDETSPNNHLLGWIIEEHRKTGAFGDVYKAYSPEGNEVAVKVLLQSIRRNPDLLHAFRRGVRSMRILEKYDVKGMVKYHSAFEIPPFVVMDWIEGPDLSDVVRAGGYEDWIDILFLFKELATCLHAAHSLPERVLHRDLRPANIMIRNYYTDRTNAEIVLTDFDLSWHKGATEKSVTHGSMAGYLAPEQLTDIQGVSTRHSSVDSFGLGMTMFFVLSRKEPFPAQHKHKDWENDIIEVCKNITPCELSLIPNRISRLIVKATMDSQSERLDMGQLYAELTRLYKVLQAPNSISSAELIAEEIAARCLYHQYEWDPDSFSASIQYANGIIALVEGDETRKKVELKVEWTSTGTENRKKLTKYIEKLQDRITPTLSNSGWERVRVSTKRGIFTVYSEITVSGKAYDLDALSNSIDKCCSNVIRV